ncbi:hypothetical protein Cgig2_006012 [Carnegiea gigantea]|uniref:DUF4283 domain-containing protein n=1 Tax=Carnegiea gigantea TaxID=171969 RepID=A0A9Q1L143_9CARY|nr:hypothetical protein Cgig2_006012 [Carnegiea gigantea]
MKTVLKNIWKPEKGVIIRDLDTNLFAFQFFSSVDKLFVLNEGQWSFDEKILLLKEVTGFEKPFGVSFTTTRFWVKASDLPAKKQTIDCVQMIGNKIGSFVDCDETTMIGVDKSMSFQVDIDINKPFMRGVRILVAKQPMWIKIGYVKLPDLCYGCGMLDHVYAGCALCSPQTDEADLQYVSDLKEEKRLYQAFHNNKLGAKVRTKLVFNDNDQGPREHSKLRLDSTANPPSKMIIDDVPLINSATDFSKSKADLGLPLTATLGQNHARAFMSPGTLSKRAVSFIRSFRAAQERDTLPKPLHRTNGRPLDLGSSN